MNWKLKAKIQNLISHLPSSPSYAAYYWVQRHFGGLNQINPISRLNAAIETWKLIQELGVDPRGKVFMEIGTGRVPLIPLAYWLMGAEKTITIDLNPYLKSELVVESIQYITNHKSEIFNLFGPLIDKGRFDELQALGSNPKWSVSDFLEMCQVDYVAPGDAAKTNLPEQCIDFHTSYTVFEHIPLTALTEILKEGNRVVKINGLFVHMIDYSDHFSHSDKKISAINFLQYSDNEWKRFADNKYMYMNRLRHDDFLSLFESIGHHIVKSQPNIDQPSQELLKNGGLQLDDRFNLKSEEVLSITNAWVISQNKS